MVPPCTAVRNRYVTVKRPSPSFLAGPSTLWSAMWWVVMHDQ